MTGKIFSVVLVLSAGIFVRADAAESGSLELIYEPKVCVMEPCPQFIVVKMNGEAPTARGADLINLDPAKSSLSNFRKIRVKGSWEQDKDYLKVTVEEWSALVAEKVEGPKKTDEHKK